MKTLYLFITAIIGIFVGVLLVFLVNLIIYCSRKRRILRQHEKKHCNFCESSYIDNHSIYCPECGELLTLHKSDELFSEKYRNRTIHYLKIDEYYYQYIQCNLKRFELRKNDRNYKVGDLIIFKRIVNYTNYILIRDEHVVVYKIDYVLNNVPEYGLDNDYCILSISRAFKCDYMTNSHLLVIKQDSIRLNDFFESDELLCIHCSTSHQAEILLKAFNDLGKKWSTCESYIENSKFNIYGTNTIYFNDGTYGDLSLAIEENYRIFHFDNVIFEVNNNE
ncbi:MAG: DUF3850 domain-containing protein [Erysipelotrichales bacterium]|nr:DUF3850 domain-containing protein [Erysipelotrichales bacterium]